MAYSDDIIALGPDHRWAFDLDLLDSEGSLDGINTSIDFPTTPICSGGTASARTNATSDNISVADANDINLVALSQFYIGGWIQLSGKQGPPTCIWKAGGLTSNRGIFTGVNNNNLVFQHSESTGATVVQNYSDIALANVRNYYVGMRFDNGICDAFIDGVKQSISDPSDSDTGNTTFPIHNNIDWGNIDSNVNLGGSAILIKALVTCLYKEWHSFSGASIPTNTEIRDVLFEKGALPDTIITTGTQAVMQTSIDGEADTIGHDVECDLELEAVTGDGNLTISLDNRTFNSRASIHIRYLGTGVLTVRNTNGSNASIGSTPNGGTIIFSTPVTITITCKDATTGSVIEGARVFVLDSNLAQLINTSSNVSGVVTSTYDFVEDETITGRVRKGSGTYYKTAPISGVITENGLDLTILMISDE